MKKISYLAGGLLAFALITPSLPVTHAAVDCQDAIGSTNYTCDFKEETGVPTSTCLNFTSPGAGGANKLDAKLGAAHAALLSCMCESKGSFSGPTFNASLELLCGGGGNSLEAKTTASGAKIINGTYLKGSNKLAYAFECQENAGCVVPPVCGNGVVESGEQCDDGNTTNGDGCSSACQIVAPPACSSQSFTFNMTSSNGGTFTIAEWPGGTETKSQNASCTVTVKRPSDDVSIVGNLGDKWQVTSFTGFSSCFGIGGEDSNGVATPNCSGLTASAGFVQDGRPSCTNGLCSFCTGQATNSFTVQCVP